MILRLIKALAEYEKLGHEVVATEDGLREALFGARPIRRGGDRVRGRRAGRFRALLSQFLDVPRRPGPVSRGSVRRAVLARPRVRAQAAGAPGRRSRWRAAATGWSGRCSTGTSRPSRSTAGPAPACWMTGVSSGSPGTRFTRLLSGAGRAGRAGRAGEAGRAPVTDDRPPTCLTSPTCPTSPDLPQPDPCSVV